ncbi:uncharacterized protein LOC112341390 [Selaginella moellendorffii]|uniref:uncharacterized protein LOC112341390 n=1 Tax=Selaginella moellendorffii TaxID=88036 RepID=UPI000D1CAF98|nr:uncharacterized protein LOC112341390 [Selaginella moellendorffii]|eukprot:XP_024517160.1 uncharacterized protein LOC112341390 [Selaginella moellendorffii]
MYSYEPRSPMSLNLALVRVLHACDFLEDMQDKLELAKLTIRQVQGRDKRLTNKHRRHQEYKVGDKVFLKLSDAQRSPKGGGNAKLSPCYCGHWTILQHVGDLAYTLDLPVSLKIYPTFHVSKLKVCLHSGDVVDQSIIQVLEIDVENVDSTNILAQRLVKTRWKTTRELLVQWNGYSMDEATWETEDDVKRVFLSFGYDLDNIPKEGEN